MEKKKKAARYQRIYKQLDGLVESEKNPISRMSSIAAVLHHKMEYFFWTGFYLLIEGELLVHSYQGPVACMKLKKNSGVCWAGIDRKESVVVDEVEKFPGHIACDSRSKSEIVVPLRDINGDVYGVLDVDSSELNSFDEIDALWLEKIVELINK
ncbi:MAG: GAF domain-containing protein [Bacteroidota bacterium]|nr:GAF domain-containing protein [Bacteroidota bacterium]